MIVAGFDVETTGIRIADDHIVQVGLVLWDTKALIKKAKVKMDRLINCPALPPMDEEVIRIHGITNEDLILYGKAPVEVFAEVNSLFDQADAVVAHNGNIFDRPMYENNCRRHGVEPLEKLWIDTMCDIEFPPEISTRKLSFLAAEHGFINPFPHDACSDVMTMLKVADKYDWDKMVEFAKAPTIIIRADVRFQEKELAKKQSFRWDADNKVWIKSIKEFQLEAARKAATEAGFKLTVVKGKA